MENTTVWNRLVRNSESLPWKYGTSTASVICGTNRVQVRCERNSSKRTKPQLLLPQYGTSSWSEKISVSCSNGRERYGTIGFAPTGLMHGDSDATVVQAMGTMNNQVSQSALLARLDNKVISKIMGESGQLANDILELRKTRNMVADSLVGLVQGLRGLRRGKPLKEVFRTLKKEGYLGTLGNKWLETIYGWIPTVEGAYQVADILSQQWQVGKYYTGKCSVREDFSPQFDFNHLSWSSTSLGKAKAHYQFLVSDPKLVQMRSLGITNPAATLWEATPWSFVLDWGLKFGQYLQTLDYALGLSNIYVQKSVRLTHEWSAQQSSQYNVGYTIESRARASGFYAYSSRMSPTNSLSASWKGFHNPFGSSNAEIRLTSALALLYQQRQLIR